MCTALLKSVHSAFKQVACSRCSDRGELGDVKRLKTESSRKWSNFNFQSTKTLYHNNLNNIAFFLQFSRAIDVICYL